MTLWLRIHDISETAPHLSNGKVAFNKMEQLVATVGEQSQNATYQIRVTRSGIFIFIKGNIEGELIFMCDRCLEPFPYFQKEPVELTLLPAHSQSQTMSDFALPPNELEVGTYQGEWLDILEILEEQMILGLPMKKICSENCKGICPRCGSNLNQKDCICPPTEHADHPFAGLVH